MNGLLNVSESRPGVGSPVRVVRASRAGFTLIEVLIAIAIVLALGAIVGVALFGRREQADIDVTKIQIESIESAMGLFYLDYRRFPNDDEGVAVLWDKELLDPDADESKWNKYMTDPQPRDLWNNEWGYRGEEPEYGEKYDLWSNGPDGEEDTEDDIKAWSDSEGDEFGDDFGSDLPAPPDGP